MHANDPRHGTNAGYLAGCRQECCRAARRTYSAARRRHLAYGRWNPWGDLDQVRDHLNRLMDSGMSIPRITTAAGLPRGIVGRLLPGGAGEAVTARTAERILSVTPDAVEATGGYVVAVGTQRRIQALACLGWSSLAVAREAGLSMQCLEKLRGQTWVRSVTHRAVRAAYERMSMTVPPRSPYTTRVRNRAARLGWLPPLAWDDDLIELPEHELLAEIARRVEAMDDAELARCSTARKNGERSPVILAASRAYGRIRKATHAA